MSTSSWSLSEAKVLRLAHEDVGIITPYHAQKLKIRTLINDREHCPMVGSVEEFQGMEKKVIIISTVRSNVEYVDMDRRHSLGFVSDERRLNGTCSFLSLCSRC